MKKVLVLMMVFAVVIAGTVLASCKKDDGSGELVEGLGYFSSRDEIINRIDEYASKYASRGYGCDFGDEPRGEFAANDALAPTLEKAGGQGAGDDYTRTNTQVDGVDEGDIIKADGSNIYILNQSGFYIVGVDGGDAEKLAEIKIDNYVPHEMYVAGDTLIIIGGIYVPNTGYYPAYDIAIAPGCCWYPGTDKTDIRFYNIADRAAPVLNRQITLSGYYNTSRLTDGVLYYVINYNFYYGNKETYIPKISDSTVEGGAEKEISPSDIKFFDGIPSYNYLITGKIALDNSVALLKAYLGSGGTIYVSAGNIYAAIHDYNSRITFNGGTMSYDYSRKTATRIVRIALADLNYTGTGSVEGAIKDRYSLDEYEGCLRVATTTNYYDNNTGKQYSNVFVLGADLKIVGKITDIAPGESIYSVRFNGDEGSLVTFRQIDPLYKLNLADPANPTISDGLKKEGVSMYLHYVEGTDYIIGLGMGTKDNGWGGTTWAGIEVTLFDNSGEEAEVINSIYIGNAYSYCEALYNPKAILYDQTRNIFAFAAESWIYDGGNSYYRQDKQGYYVFGIENGMLVQRALLTDIESDIQYNNWYSYYNYSFSYIKRAARIGDYIYTVSDRFVTSYSLADFSQTDKLTLAEFRATQYGLEIDYVK